MEAMVKHPTDTVQHELVREYCKEAEGRIIIALTRADAVAIKEDLCKRFEKECGSAVLISATSAYLDRIIAQHWKGNTA